MPGLSSKKPDPTTILPEDLARSWRSRQGLVFLDSGAQGGSGISVLAAEPVDILRGNLRSDAAMLREVLQRHAMNGGVTPGPAGGLFGWVGYGGDFVLGVYPECHVFQHETQAWVREPIHEEGKQAPAGDLSAERLSFSPQMRSEAFCKLVARAQLYIAAGDIYQVNLSYPWLSSWPEGLESWSYYERLRRVSPAPYGAYLDLDGMQVMSSSPECFLKMTGRQVLTRPIKGTRPRGASQEGDRTLAAELLESVKERAELVMITDLERNDLGQVCEFGSVQVTGLLRLEPYAQVHHLVSTVEGVLRADVDHVAALQACFPGGSITGAPKKRAMEIIHELEPHARGLYTGAIGYLGFNGESQFSIAIRTAVKAGDAVRFHTGAGIVADSVPVKEWEETQHKAQGLLRAAAAGR